MTCNKSTNTEQSISYHSFLGSVCHSLNSSRVPRMTLGLGKRGLPTLVEPSPPCREALLLTPPEPFLRGWRASHGPPRLLGAWPPAQTPSVSLNGHHLLNVSMFHVPAVTFTRSLVKDPSLCPFAGEDPGVRGASLSRLPCPQVPFLTSGCLGRGPDLCWCFFFFFFFL